MVKKYNVTFKKNLKYFNSLMYKIWHFFSLLPFLSIVDVFSVRLFSSQLFYLLINVLSMSAFFLQATLFPVDIFYFLTFCPSRPLLHSSFIPVDIFYYSTFCHSRHFLSSTFCPRRRFFHSKFCPVGRFFFNVLSIDVFYCRRFLLRRWWIVYTVGSTSGFLF